MIFDRVKPLSFLCSQSGAKWLNVHNKANAVDQCTLGNAEWLAGRMPRGTILEATSQQPWGRGAFAIGTARRRPVYGYKQRKWQFGREHSDPLLALEYAFMRQGYSLLDPQPQKWSHSMYEIYKENLEKRDEYYEVSIRILTDVGHNTNI
ncbi:hypothetical protein BJV82DRAFT_578249 [Fennellomyces sp. T-0311]|nr:hypothetical protein BJV82DRAFT_578249 [Fennellomyces sp. T-0311]